MISPDPVEGLGWVKMEHDSPYGAIRSSWKKEAGVFTLEVDVPVITLPVAAGRNLAVLVEAAVRSHVLKSKGIDAAQTFIDRQAHQMRKQQPW